MNFVRKSIAAIRKQPFDKVALAILCLLLFLYLIYAYLIDAFRSGVNIDAGYYMGVANLIYEGYLPYRDFELGYTPLFFYVMQPFLALMGDCPNYTIYKLLQCLITFANALLLGKLIIRMAKTSCIKAAFFSVVFLIFWYNLEGVQMVLENLSVFFGLCSLLLVTDKRIRYNAVWAGIFAAFTFLAKQYGLVFFGSIGVYLLLSGTSWKEKAWICLLFVSGFIVTLVLFIGVFWLMGVEPTKLLEAISGGGYGQQTFYWYKLGVVKAVRLFPFLLFFPCLFFNLTKEEIAKIALCLTGLLLSSFQLYFNVFPHYYLFMLPFVFVLCTMIFEKMKALKGTRILFLLFWGFLFTASALLLQNIWNTTKYLQKVDERETVTEIATHIKGVVKAHHVETTLCYWGTIEYYGLCSLTPPLKEKYGFSFGDETEESMSERLNHSDSFIVAESSYDYLKKEMEGLVTQIENDFYIPKDGLSGDVMVFVRNGL